MVFQDTDTSFRVIVSVFSLCCNIITVMYVTKNEGSVKIESIIKMTTTAQCLILSMRTNACIHAYYTTPPTLIWYTD